MSTTVQLRTLRIRTERKSGALGSLTAALGQEGLSIVDVQTVQIGHNFIVRDFHLSFLGDEHLLSVQSMISSLAGSKVIEVINMVEKSHCGGKIRQHSRIDLSSMTALQTSYDPGVSEIIQKIDIDPELAYKFTALGRTVAIVSDGSGLSGYGRVNTQAMLPVLEAKAALLAQCAGLNSLPLVLEVNSEEQLLQTIKSMSSSCGAILLDAVNGERGFRIKTRLNEILDLPIFDDDSDLPSICVLAALINTCEKVKKDLKKLKVGQLGLGTAGSEIARLVMAYTGNSVLGEDVHPAALARHVYRGGENASLEEIMSTCDVVIANTGHGNVIDPKSVRKGQIIFALSVPSPEIEAYDALSAGASYAVDGLALSKIVALPGVLLGALAVCSTEINDAMRIAAAQCLAENADIGEVLPTPFEENIHAKVALAVASAAIRSGVSKVENIELSEALFISAIKDEKQLPFFKTSC